MMRAIDRITEVIEEEFFERTTSGLDGAGVAYREWFTCTECQVQATDIELVKHDPDCFVGKVEDLIMDSYK